VLTNLGDRIALSQIDRTVFVARARNIRELSWCVGQRSAPVRDIVRSYRRGSVLPAIADIIEHGGDLRIIEPPVEGRYSSARRSVGSCNRAGALQHDPGQRRGIVRLDKRAIPARMAFSLAATGAGLASSAAAPLSFR
jgi:hypothetical protein